MQRDHDEHDACGVGFLADLGGHASRDVVRLALEAVASMEHRGARGADGRTGDGAGILLETPRALYLRELAQAHIRVPERHVAAVCVFLPTEPGLAAALRVRVEAAVRAENVAPLRWRIAPVEPSVLGEGARHTAPSFEHLLVDVGPGNARERMRAVRRGVLRTLSKEGDAATLVSASATTVVYKGLLSSHELADYFTDLRDEEMTSRFAVFHQRFSTNTSPRWRLVQPFSLIAHNGEIDTITGNRAWMRARGVASPSWASDSMDFNIALDAMIGGGYRVDEAVDFMLSPSVDDERLRALYDAHVPTIEPWDGPAAIAFADGDRVGAALDRSGFRPMRWCRTASGKVLAASETGVVDFGDDEIVERGRLGPGERILVHFATGELVRPDAFRALRRATADFRSTVASWSFDAPLDDAPAADPEATKRDLVRFGVTKDELATVIAALANGAEAVSSMGDDAAPPFLERGFPVAAYLRQRFAQVTNPPIDALREGFVFDVRAWVGAGATNGDVPAPDSIVKVESAILGETAFDALTYDARLVPHRIALDFAAAEGSIAGLEDRLAAIAAEAERAVRGGATYLVLDDRNAVLPVPAVLAAGVVHQRLTTAGLRMQASIAVCDGFARDAHGVAAALAAGANVVTPWLAARAGGDAPKLLSALRTGLVKILAKLGICTLRSYVGAQTFESLGLSREVVEMCFPGMAAHVPLVTFADLEDDIRGWAAHSAEGDDVEQRGLFRFRRDGIRHSFDPALLKGLRKTIVARDEQAFFDLSDALEARGPIALRDLIEPLAIGDPIPLDQVEPEEAILARFVTAAMSLGALSPEAHDAIGRGAVLAGARSNGGEGGEDPDKAPHQIKQIASARFGVSAKYLATAEEIEIKIAQGAKPGEGGQIPGFKVTAEIASFRGAAPGQTLVSPPPHHDIYSIEDLAQLIYDLRRANPQARIAVKLVAQSGIGYVASGVAKARADVIHVAGHDGGTGASPLASIKHAGLPWELGLVETQHSLVSNGLRGRVKVRVDGGFKTGRDVIIGTLLGADAFGFGSALLVALGCIYARQCHENTCPVGVATQDAVLRGKFPGTPEDAETFLRFIARDVRRRLAALGAHSLEALRGRSDLLRTHATRVTAADLSEILRLPETRMPYDVAKVSDAHIDDSAVPGGTQHLTPVDRAVAARIAYTRTVGPVSPDATYNYTGSAGQSFGAFLCAGLTLELDGDANDGVGKGMSGGTIVVRGAGTPDEPAIGNACFYGSRGGAAYVRGAAGERLAVRNSGATIVIEGAGDHACEYMTAGRVLILGKVGRNLASGMTGGEMFIAREHLARLGPTPLQPHALDANDRAAIRALAREHAQRTGSKRGAALASANDDELNAYARLAVPAAVTAESAAVPAASLR